MTKQLKFSLAKGVATLCVTGVCFGGQAFANGPSYPTHNPGLVPSNPTPGECYQRVEIPAQFSTSTQGVLVEEGYQTVRVDPAQLETRQENVLVKEASVRYEVRQPTYRTVSDQILVRPAYEKLSVVPPQFRTVQETVKTSQPRLVWKFGNPAQLARKGYKVHSTADAGPRGQGYRSTTQFGAQGGDKCGANCEIWCLVEEPAQTASFNRKVLTTPTRVQRVPVPPKYKTISKQVVADPGGVRKVPVPAEYKTVIVEDLIAPAREQVEFVPPKYAGIETKSLVSSERFEWRRVICQPGTGSIRSSESYSQRSSGAYGASSSHSTHGYSGQGYSAPTYSSPTYSGSSHSGTYTQGRTYSGATSSTSSGHSTYSGSSYSGSSADIPRLERRGPFRERR